MHEDLQPLANLRIGKTIDQAAEESIKQLRELNNRLAANGNLLTGHAEVARFNIRAGAVEKVSRTIANTWVELLVKKQCRLTRDDLTFIMQQVEGHTLSQAKNLSAAMASGPGRTLLPGNYWMEQADTKMHKVAGDIRRDLEISFREQEAFPPPKEALAPMTAPPIQLHIQNSNISNLNLGTQVGTINAALQLLSTEDKDHQALAKAIKELTEAVVADRHLDDGQKREAVEALSELANEAQRPGRIRATAKALVSWLPQVIGLSADLLTLWDKSGPIVRGFFKV
jgi:hypothetical protein